MSTVESVGATRWTDGIAAAEQFALAGQLADHFPEVVGFLGEQLNAPFGLESFVGVSKNQGVENLVTPFEARERGFGGEHGMIPAPGDEVLGHPELLLAGGQVLEGQRERLELRGTLRDEIVVEFFGQQILVTAAEEAFRGGVDLDDTEVRVQDEDGVQGTFQELRELFLTGAELELGLEAAMFGGGAGGKDFEQRDGFGVGRHRFGVEHGEVTEHFALGIQQRGSQIADRVEGLEIVVTREQRDDVLREMNQ
jgi:hypothetical protein